MARFERLRKLVRPGGVQRGMRAMTAALARRYLQAPFSAIGELEMVLTQGRPASILANPCGPLRINWILLDIAPAQGGLLNIFRTIQQLELKGHENRIYVSGKLPGGPALAKKLVRERYFDIQAEVEILNDNIRDSDALIATSWPTAYTVRGLENTAQKFYFVQDIEYMFYAPGSLYELAKQTYQFGFRGITLGPWIAEVLKRDFNMECSAFGFSYDRDSYTKTGSLLLPPGKKRVLFYARPETERRGFELGILALSLVHKSIPGAEFVLVGFQRQSLDVPFPAIFPGVVPISKLGSLYRSCDVALVLSHTNLSMLPLELMACGCAVVSNMGANVEWLLNNQTATLAEPTPQSLADAITELLEREDLRLQKVENGLAFSQSTDWAKEIQIIESALLSSRKNSHQISPPL